MYKSVRLDPECACRIRETVHTSECLSNQSKSDMLGTCTNEPLLLEHGTSSEVASLNVGIGEQSVGVIDWDNLEIQETQDEEGRIQIMSEDQLYGLLGLRDEDERAKSSKHVAGPSNVAETSGPRVIEDTEGAAVPVDDAIPGELIISYDKDNPCMDLGTKYPSMKEFRLAVRQYAINKEFELGTDKSDKERFRGFCTAEGCQWRIVGRRQSDKKTIMVLTCY